MIEPTDRRGALRRGMIAIAALGVGGLALGGCSSSSSSSRKGNLPTARWPDQASSRPPSRRWEPLPETSTPSSGGYSGELIPRSDWARGQPVPALMDRADRPYNAITLHHDGMDAFTSTNRSAAAARIEKIRAAHRSRNFGDIGYHYLIDPAGRVWCGRDLYWQGAHVKGQNPGRLGVCLMGNYSVQRPNQAQLEALSRFTTSQMRRYGIPVSQVQTHMELAQTECPGRNLQPMLVSMRRNGGTLARA